MLYLSEFGYGNSVRQCLEGKAEDSLAHSDLVAANFISISLFSQTHTVFTGKVTSSSTQSSPLALGGVSES